MRTFSIYTLGCKVNQYESAQIAQLLEQLGLSAAVSGEKPDLAVINTCCVTGTASAKSRQYIQRALKANPAGVRVVCGCLPAMNSRENPPCDGDNVYIINRRDDLAQRITQIIIGDNPFIKAKNGLKIKDGMAKFAKYPKLPQLFSFKGHTRAFLKVQDGCDGLCAYCIVPKVRPDVQSKPIEEAIEEAKALVASGHKEIVVTGVNLGAYGRDTTKKSRTGGPACPPKSNDQKSENHRRGEPACSPNVCPPESDGQKSRRGRPMCLPNVCSPNTCPPKSNGQKSRRGGPMCPPNVCPSNTCSPIANLLENLAKIDGLLRIRVSSLEPGDISEELLDVFCAHANIMPHIHLSVQSGSSATLKRMCRQYDAEELRAKIELIKRRLDRPAITCDIIVGFPGETDDDFAETVELSNWAGFSKIHVFPFSVRTGTPATKLKGRLPADVIKTRAQTLRKLSDALGRKFVEQFVGKTCEVLLENTEPLSGRCERYFAVSLATKTPRHEENQNNLVPLGFCGKGEIVKVRITEATSEGATAEEIN